jgi:hypothetical protein
MIASLRGQRGTYPGIPMPILSVYSEQEGPSGLIVLRKISPLALLPVIGSQAFLFG